MTETMNPLDGLTDNEYRHPQYKDQLYKKTTLCLEESQDYLDSLMDNYNQLYRRTRYQGGSSARIDPTRLPAYSDTLNDLGTLITTTISTINMYVNSLKDVVEYPNFEKANILPELLETESHHKTRLEVETKSEQILESNNKEDEGKVTSKDKYNIVSDEPLLSIENGLSLIESQITNIGKLIDSINNDKGWQKRDIDEQIVNQLNTNSQGLISSLSSYINNQRASVASRFPSITKATAEELARVYGVDNGNTEMKILSKSRDAGPTSRDRVKIPPNPHTLKLVAKTNKKVLDVAVSN